MSRKLKQLELEVLAPSKSGTASITLGGGKNLTKLKMAHPSRTAILELSNPSWTVALNAKTKDVTVTRKRAFSFGTLQVKQWVPSQQLYLVPNPEVKMTFKPLKLPLKFNAETVLTHDFLARRGTLQQDLVYKRLRASVTCNSDQGLTNWSLTAKPGKKWLSSTGLHMSRGGPVIKAEGAVGSGKRTVRVKTEVHAQGKGGRAEINVPVVDRLRLNLTSALSKPVKAGQKPSVSLGTRFEYQFQ